MLDCDVRNDKICNYVISYKITLFFWNYNSKNMCELSHLLTTSFCMLHVVLMWFPKFWAKRFVLWKFLLKRFGFQRFGQNFGISTRTSRVSVAVCIMDQIPPGSTVFNWIKDHNIKDKEAVEASDLPKDVIQRLDNSMDNAEAFVKGTILTILDENYSSIGKIFTQVCILLVFLSFLCVANQ